MEYISSDTNVWIDFSIINKLDLPFKLSYGYLMVTEAIHDELLSPSGLREQLISLGLIETELTEEEFYYAIGMIGKYSKLSKYDGAALAIAKFRGIPLLTGDAALRKVATSQGIDVVGTIGIIDKLFEEGLISLDEYKECLILLIKHNGHKVRLPQEELLVRLKKNNG